MSEDPNTASLVGLQRTASDIYTHLRDVLEAQDGRVHFRPTRNSITMVGLLPDRPQRGHGGYQAQQLKSVFASDFPRYCVNIEQGRPTPEKRLQSFLISNAYRHQRSMQALQHALPQNEDTHLYFLTDEVPLLLNGDKVVCDLLAFNRRADGIAPVLIELKSERAMSRLIDQLNNYALIFNRYQSYFESFFSALIGENICFTLSPEKWLVWPSMTSSTDPREVELLARGIRVVGYTETENGFSFKIGQRP